jgi:hypothetical protein
MADTLTFRIHFADGTKVVVDAPNPTAARKIAEKRHDAIVTKVKLVKDAA